MSSSRSQQGQSAHDRMVAEAVRVLRDKGFSGIKADHVPNHTRPQTISWKGAQSGHIPDITAEGILLEVETSDSITTSHTEDQLKLFNAYSKQYQKDFWIIVPVAAKREAENRMRQLGLTARIWGM